MAVIALDIGGTKLAGGLFLPHGPLRPEQRWRLQGLRDLQLLEQLRDSIAELSAEAAALGQEIDAVGICIPGICYPESGDIWAPNLTGPETFPLRRGLQKLLGPHSPELFLDSDRAGSILGEAWLGAARGCRHAALLMVGTGVGAGILADGRVLRGLGDIAGAVGWMCVDREYQPAYACCGCLETLASGQGLARAAQQRLAAEPERPSLLRRLPVQDVTAQHIFSAFQEQDEVAQEMIGMAVSAWGALSANLISLLNPELVLFGGGLFGPATELLPLIRQEAQRWAQPLAWKQCRIGCAALGENAVLYGSALIALQRGQAESWLQQRQDSATL